MIINRLKNKNCSLNKSQSIKSKKVKFITCVNCGKFCQSSDIENFKKVIGKYKQQGYDTIVFSCASSVNFIKDFIYDKETELFNQVNIGIKDSKGKIKLLT